MVAARALLTADRLRALLHYEPLTGVFTRRIARGNSRAGAVVGSIDVRGYRIIAVDKRDYRAHRLAFLYMTGKWPEGDVDHRFGVHDDNRWSEIRDVSHSVNGENQRGPRANTTSGYLGVASRANGMFTAQIRVRGTHVYFSDPATAHEAYLAAKRRLHEGCTI